jgi:predicted unusual protein kinase regulating ubiquinone biosynthesis (AarF/ABC1/UbiB family)
MDTFSKGIKLLFSLSFVCILQFVNYFVNIDLWYYYLKLIELNGPVFIKFFQHIGEYNQHIPFLHGNEEYLQQIKEKINFHSREYTMKVIDKYNLELNILPNFCKSGSLGQVHKCIYQNKISSLKILHPNIRREIDDNFYYLNKFLNCFAHQYQIDTDGLYQSILIQSDLNAEADNYKKFRINFQQYPNIIFPQLYYNNNEVIISEFIEFPDQGKLKPEDYKEGVVLYIIAVYKMLFIDNFVHGDLHSGNWKIIPNKANKPIKIVFFDTAVHFKINNLKHLQKTFYYDLINNRPKLLYYTLKFLEKEDLYDKLIENFADAKDPWKYVLDNILRLQPDTKIKDKYIYVINTLNSCREYLKKFKFNNYHIIQKINQYKYYQILDIFDIVDVEIHDNYILFNEPKRKIRMNQKGDIHFENY